MVMLWKEDILGGRVVARLGRSHSSSMYPLITAEYRWTFGRENQITFTVNIDFILSMNPLLFLILFSSNSKNVDAIVRNYHSLYLYYF